MKKILILIVIAGIFLLSNATKGVTKSKAHSTEWGEWMNDDCFKGIDYRARKGDYNNYAGKWNWYVQFRNRYQEPIYYSYIVSEPGTHHDPDHRDNMDGNSISESKLTLLYNANSVHIRVGYIRFGTSDYGKYASCDK